jgi:hypothetical protein
MSTKVWKRGGSLAPAVLSVSTYHQKNNGGLSVLLSEGYADATIASAVQNLKRLADC